jgi:hypothetical protein
VPGGEMSYLLSRFFEAAFFITTVLANIIILRLQYQNQINMFSGFPFWIWGVIISQFLTALFHSLSFISPAKPRNETEKQLTDLVTNYKINMGAGIKRSFYNLFIGVSVCFTLIYVLGGIMNWYFVRSGVSVEIWNGFLLIQVIVYGAIFVLQLRFTFLPPIIVTGLVFIFLTGAYIITKK